MAIHNRDTYVFPFRPYCHFKEPCNPAIPTSRPTVLANLLQPPELLVGLVQIILAPEEPPAPEVVDEVEGQRGDALQRRPHQEVDAQLCRRRRRDALISAWGSVLLRGPLIEMLRQDALQSTHLKGSLSSRLSGIQ